MIVYGLIIFLIFIYFYHIHEHMTLIKSNYDNNFYRVRNVEDKFEAANTLAQLNEKIIDILDFIKTKYPHQENVKRLISNYNPRRLYERPVDSTFAAYSVNKGEQIFICIRKKNTGQLINDFNILIYVLLHELAHVMTKSQGHTDEFWNNYKFLLHSAAQSGKYAYKNYDKTNSEYCGVKLLSIDKAQEMA